MTTITVKLPGEAAGTVEFEVHETHVIHGDESTFTRADAILDFSQALFLATSWATAQAVATGTPHRAEFTGDPEGDDSTITIAYVKDATIEFARWNDSTSVPDSPDEYGHGLDGFPFDLEWAIAPITVEEFFQENVSRWLCEEAGRLYLAKRDMIDSVGNFYDDETSAEDILAVYSEALLDLVLAGLDETPPEGLRAYVHAQIIGDVE